MKNKDMERFVKHMADMVEKYGASLKKSEEQGRSTTTYDFWTTHNG